MFMGENEMIYIYLFQIYTHFTRYDRMDGCSAVANHEYVLGVGKQHLQIVHRLESQRVFVAQSRCRHPVPSDNFQNE